MMDARLAHRLHGSKGMESEGKESRNELLKHILPSSPTMVGVCITALSIVKLAKLTGAAA